MILGVKAQEVINAGKFGYDRTNVAMPGLVGGPCLQKDPHILLDSTKKLGIELKITAAARYVNEQQPKETVGQIKKLIKKLGLRENANILLAGIAFKGLPETDDIRGAMSLEVLKELKKKLPESNINLFDPVIDKKILSKHFPRHKCFEA